MVVTIPLHGTCPLVISLRADYNRPVLGLSNKLSRQVIGVEPILSMGQVCGHPSSGAGRAVPGTGGGGGWPDIGQATRPGGWSWDQLPILPVGSARRGHGPWRGPSGEAG